MDIGVNVMPGKIRDKELNDMRLIIEILLQHEPQARYRMMRYARGWICEAKE